MKKILILGHPRCGSGYMSELFKSLGLDVRHEEMGVDGLASWAYSPPVNVLEQLQTLKCPWGPRRRAGPDETIIHYVRDPYYAMASIHKENDNQESWNYRRIILNKMYGINLNAYNGINRAAMSFLYWNQMIKDQDPELVVKVEDCIEEIKGFVQKNNGYIPDTIELPPTDYNHRERPTVRFDGLRPDLLVALDKWCIEYGYPEFSTRIPQVLPTTPPKLPNPQIPIHSKRPQFSGVRRPNARQLPSPSEPRNLIRGDHVTSDGVHIQPRQTHDVQQVSELTTINSCRHNKKIVGFSVNRR